MTHSLYRTDKAVEDKQITISQQQRSGVAGNANRLYEVETRVRRAQRLTAKCRQVGDQVTGNVSMLQRVACHVTICMCRSIQPLQKSAHLS